jgi:DNA-binding NtrC family response regulator
MLLLAEHFLRRCARKHGIKVNGFSDSARAALAGYRWPGNVREMQNTIERAVILTESGRPVTASALGLPGIDYHLEESAPPMVSLSTPPFEVRADSPPPAGNSVSLTDSSGGVQTIANLEKQAIKAALVQTEGNRTQAAAVLGISIRTLRNKLQEYREAGDPIDAGMESAEA